MRKDGNSFQCQYQIQRSVNGKPCTAQEVSPEQSAHYDTVPQAVHCHHEPTKCPTLFFV